MHARRALSALSSKTTAVLGLGLLALQGAQAQEPLNYFKNYFVTGDFAVSGVGLAGQAGSATGTINLSSVPCTSGPGFFASVLPCNEKNAQPADVIAAFLYWQAIETTPAPAYASGTFDGPASTNSFLSVQVGNIDVPACGPGSSTQTNAFARVYRADVLRFLPINSTADVRVANGTHTIQLTSGNAATQFVGMSLVVVYRLVTPGNPRIAPLRSVVIYDGAFTGTASLGLNQTMGGFYQASQDPDAAMAQLVGEGEAENGKHQTLTVNGSTPPGVPTNPFIGAQGKNWDNFRFDFDLQPNASSLNTQVKLSGDCLTWAAIVASTNVQDTDNDGLLDIWETSGLNLSLGARNDGLKSTEPVPPTFGTCVTNATTCLNLPKMGANPFVPDIFMQIDWMQSQTPSQADPPHIHNPQLAALNMVGAAFKAHGINMHFDVGGSSTYQGSPYIVPAPYAQGGNVIQESSVECTTSNCNFYPESGQYSVLGWKTGFNAIKNGDPYYPCPIYSPPGSPSCTQIGLPQLFATNRKDTFHYALFAHAIAATSPLSTPLPASISGVADRPGGDLIITLGLWRSDIPSQDQVGSALQQAGTLMHELGHNLDLSHGGWNSEPTCMPDYPSVMNYLYQTRGLTDASGNENIDYSNGFELPLSEDFLSSSFPMALFGFQKYRVRYFGPLNNNTESQGQASQVYCSGALLLPGAPPYTRLESPGVSTPDWSNGTILPLGTVIKSGLDVNYDGVVGQTFFDQPDWVSVNLQQVGARPNADGLSLNIGVSDIGVSDIGVSDIGVSDIGVSDIGVSDIGVSDIGVSDIGTANLGQDALGDEDYESHLLSGVDPPPSPSPSCPTCGLTVANQISGNLLNWTATDTGPVAYYNIYRCNATAGTCTPAPPAIGSTSGSPAPTTYTDNVSDTVDAGATCPQTSTCYNTPYTYYVTAVVNVTTSQGSTATESGPSNTAGSTVNHLFVIANNQAIVYGNANPAPTFNFYGNVSGSLANSAVTCSYPTAPANSAGYLDASPTGYAITCTGPSTTSTTDGVTYLSSNAKYLNYTAGTLTVSQRPITVTATASNKVYDSTTTSTSIPAITGTLATGDTPGFAETYDNRNVGTTHVMTPSGIVTDNNGGNNYAVKFVTANGGVITQAPLTITASTNTKVYDGTPGAAAAPVVTGLKGTDTVTGLVETYGQSSVGTNLLLSVSPGYTVSDGNGGNNYAVTLATVSTGVISQRPVAVSITGVSKTYDTTPAASATCALTSGVIAADASSLGCTISGAMFTSSAVGTWGLTGGTVSLTGAPAGNYAVSSVAYGSATISAYPLTAAISAADKSFDGTTAATITNCSVAPLGSDNVTCSASGATFASASPGNNLTVTATVSLGGTAVNNYTLTSLTATTTASISDSINLAALSPTSASGAFLPVWTNNPLSGGGMVFELANLSGNLTTSAWLPATVPVSSAFTTTFEFQISPETGVDSVADGFAFVIQGDPAGASVVGTTGAGAYLGYTGIRNSIAVEFDTYYNSDFGDPTPTSFSGSHIGIQSNGALANDSHHNTTANLLPGGPVPANFADGNTHTATISYDGNVTLTVSLDGGSTVVSATLTSPLSQFLGLSGNSAYVGFTAATGGDDEFSDILTWSWN